MSGWGDAGQALVAAITKNPEFEREHPRGRDGRFIEKGGFVKFLDIKASLWRLAKVEDFTDDGRVKVSYTGADGKPVEEVMKKNWLYHADRPKATLSPSGWKKVGAQAGSNVGGFFEDKGGQKWYVKTPQSKLHTGNENLMNRLYVKAGAPAPETAVSPDGKNFLTKIEDSVDWHTISGDRLETVQKVAAKNFVVDAWLANWDAPLNDNVRVTPDNVVLRVDAGGAGMFRARGERRILTMDVKELQSMRDATVTGRAGGAILYAKVTKDDEINAAKRILAINPDDIKTMVSEEGLPQQLATELIARRAWLATHYGLTLPESTDEGRDLLSGLSAAKTAAEKEAAEAAIKALIKIAPDTAMELGPGAPVWVKNKSVGTVSPAGAKVPDLMVLDSTMDSEGVEWLTFKSKDGKVEYTVAKSSGSYEVLRENNASENTAYASGEKPQVGDRVDQKTGGPGVVTEMFPLYMRVMGDDGKSRVSKIAQNSLIAKVGEHDRTALALAGPGSMANIGKPADLNNADAKFPLIAFSLPHRANVLVVSYDDTTKKAKVMLSNGGAATLPANKLFDNDSVDRDALKALPTAQKRQMAPRAKRAAPALDVNALPEIEIKPNRMVTVKLNAGDRLLKAKNKSKLSFLIIRRDGMVEYAGSNKDTDGYVDDNYKHDYAFIKTALSEATVLTDVTPAKYDVASNELGPDKLKFKKRKIAVAQTLSGIDPDAFRQHYKDHAGDQSKLGRYSMRQLTAQTKSYNFEFSPEAGDEMISMVDSGSPRAGLDLGNTPYYGFSDDDDLTLPDAKTVQQKIDDFIADETSYSYVPRFWLKRADGSVYDLGYGGEFAEDESKWRDARQADLDKIVALDNQYWYSGYGADKEPTDTLSDGTTIRYQTKGGNRGDGVNRLAANRAWLMGKVPKPTGRTYRYGPTPATSYDGSGNLLEALQSDTDQWDKGNLAKLAKQALDTPEGALVQYNTVDMDAMPEGTRLYPDVNGVYERIEKRADGNWYRPKHDSIGSNEWLVQYKVRDPRIPTTGPEPAQVGIKRTFTAEELALFKPGTQLKRTLKNGNEWTITKDGLVWKISGSSTVGPDEEQMDQVVTVLGDLEVVKLPQPDITTNPAAPVVDFTETAGYKALTHKVATSRDNINDGSLDEDIHKVMTTPIVTGAGYASASLHTLPDGTVHGDPYMAQFAKMHEGDQQVLNAPTPLFNAIKNMTGHPSMHRGVSAVDQRDAIKHGEYFNGTGVYGNGTYTAAARGTAGSYGGAKVELTPKPGAKGIQNDDMYIQQGEDMAKAIRDRNDALAGDTKLPTSQEIATADYSGKNPKDVQDAVDTVIQQVLLKRGIMSTTDSDKKEILKRGAVKAAIAYRVAFNRAGLKSVITTESSGYYGNGNDETVSLTVSQKSGSDGSMKFTFQNPWTQSQTNFGRQQAAKLDQTRDYMVKTSVISAAPGKTWSTKERIRQAYNSGWWKDEFTDHLDASGIGEAIADNSSDWQAALEKGRVLDSRVTFISDPGRWALAAGYDFFFIPGQDYYIFTHRAGFIVKK